jgi:hemoglobin
MRLRQNTAICTRRVRTLRFSVTLPFAFLMIDPSSSSTLFDRIGGRAPLLKMLRYFYADVRQHAEIGPIFAAQIEDWPAHLEKIADFWSGATGGPANYNGPMPYKHLHLGLEEKHFQAWLGLWHRHCRAHLPASAADEMIERAEAIGQRLRQIVAMHGTPRPPL